MKRPRKDHFLALDADRLGLLAAMAMATLVMGISFLRSVGLGPALIRGGLALVVTYAVVFLLVRYVIRAALAEIAQEEVQRKEQLREQEAARENEEGSGLPGPGEGA